MPDNYRFIISGGPGSGKSSLIESLKKKGYCVFPEEARQMIRDGVVPPIHQTHEKRSGLFLREILKKRIVQYLSAPGNEISFYDRGIPDSLAFNEYLGVEKAEVLVRSAKKYRYNSPVFLLPPWKDIYKKDQVRREDFSVVEKIYHHLKKVYSELAYEYLELPLVSVEERMQIVIEKAESVKAH